MIIRLSPDASGGGAAPAGAAPAPSSAPASSPPAGDAPKATPGPKAFTPSAQATPNFKPKSFREALNDHTDTPEKKQDAKDGQVTPPAANKEPEKKLETPPTNEPPKPKEKVNNWKALEQSRDDYKRKWETSEARLKDYEGQRVPEQERTALSGQMDQLRKRNEELENEIRFVNFKKSKDYTEKFLQPYEFKWQEAVAFLGKIPVTDKTGTQRAGSQEDLQELYFLDPLAMDARALELAGGSPTLAGRIVSQVEKLQELGSALTKAEQDALANGKTRDEERKNRTDAQKKELDKWVVKEANSFAEEWNKDPLASSIDLFKPREDGKELTPDEVQHNANVTKGIEMAKSLDNLSKRLAECKTVEERKTLLKKSVAFIKRGIHFGPLRQLYHKQGKELAEVKAKLAEYEKTSPDTTGGRRATAPIPTNSPLRVRLRESLNRHAGR